MKIGQALKMALRSILGNKARSVLTMLGIIIGIASVMVIVSTINGMNRKSLEQFEAMGTNRVELSCYLYNGQDPFESIYNYCSSLGSDLVLGVTPTGYCSPTVVYGSRSTESMRKNEENMWNNGGEMDNTVALPPSQYYGSDQYAICNNFELAKGRDISVIDIRN